MFLFKRTLTSKTLAIIGNGFDLTHEFQTGYQSFSERTPSPYFEKFKAFCDDESTIINWYDFENNIRILTGKLFQQSITDECDPDDNQKAVDDLRVIFREIHNLLIQYLQHEISSKPFINKDSIAKHFNKQSVAINFNYTNTAEAYSKHIFYVHGSLSEQDILLGYDYRDEPCLAQYENMCWSKTLCREALAFRRYLRRRIISKGNKLKTESLLSGLEAYHYWEETGRGIDDEVKLLIPSYKLIDRFLRKFRENPLPPIKYKKVKKLVVLGHGIEADRVYLSQILSQCKTLQEIIIYKYDCESAASINMKKEFFSPFCNNIQVVSY